MSENMFDETGRTSASFSTGKTLLGILVGGGLFLAVMLVLAGIAVFCGLIASDPTGRWLLGPWLALESFGGAIAGVLAGAISRRIAKRYLAVSILAATVFCVALLEATELLRNIADGRVMAPTWLVLIAPLVTGGCVLLGGWRPGARSHCITKTHSTLRMSDAVRYSLPIAVLVAAVVLAVLVLPSVAGETESFVVASALTLDFTLVVPGLVLVTLVRSRRAPWIILVPTFLVGYVLASVTIPRQDHALLEVIRLIAIPAELALLAYIVVRTRSVLLEASAREGDFATRFRSVAREALSARIPADVLTTEISIFYYAFGWRRSISQSPGAFTVHRNVGYLGVVIGLTMVLFFETVALHALLSQWSVLAAWILTGLSIYGCIWLVGDYRAMADRPLCVTATHLLLRVGVRWETEIPRASIEKVELVGPNDSPPKKGTLVCALLGQPNFRVKLYQPREIVGMYGIRKTVQEIWLTVDDAVSLCKSLSG